MGGSAGKGEVVVDVWLADHPYFPGLLDPLRRRAEEFEAAHPRYRIAIEGHDFRKLPQDVAAAVGQGTPPALAEYYTSATQLARDTLAADGTPLFTSVEGALAGRAQILDEPVVIGEIEPTAREYYSVGGELVSVPITVTTPLLFTNLTALRAARVAEIPRTWAEWEAACRAVVTLPHGPSHGACWPLHGWLVQQAIAQQGAPLTDRRNGRAGRATRTFLDSTELLAHVEWLELLHRDGLYLYTGHQGDWAAAHEAFVEGSVAFTVASSVQTGALVAAGRAAGFEVVASRLPHNGDVRFGGNPISGQSFWLTAGLDSAVEDGALAFTQFLLGATHAAAWHRATGFAPVTRPAFELLTAQGWFDEHPQLAAATDQLRAAAPTPEASGALLGDLAGVQDVVTQAVEDVLVRQADPRGRLAVAQRVAGQLVDDYNLRCTGPGARTPHPLVVG